MPLDLDRGVLMRILLFSLLVGWLGLAPEPHAARSALNQARQALQRGDPLTASARLAQAADFFPRRLDLHSLAGRYALQGGDADSAIANFELADPYLAPPDLLLLGDAYQQEGQVYIALALWQHVADLNHAPEAYQRLARQHLALQDFAAAANDYQALLAGNPGDAQLNYQVALLYAASQPEAALAYLAQAGQFDPALKPKTDQLARAITSARLFEQPAYTFVSVGRELAGLGEWQLAQAAFQRAASLRADYAEAWAFLGEALQHNQAANLPPRARPGLAELERALRLDPQSVSATMLLGLFWQRQGDYEQARSYIEAALRLDPENPILHAERGFTLASQGDLPAAQAAYLTAIQLAPRDPLFYRILAEFSLQRQIQVREIGLPAARQAVLLDPADPLALDLMGQALIFLEDYANAERFLLRALQADPDNAEAHLHLGLVWLYTGKAVEASQEIALAGKLAPHSSTADQAARLLDYYFP